MGGRWWRRGKRRRERLLEDRPIALVLHQRRRERIAQDGALDSDGGRGARAIYRLGDANLHATLPEHRYQRCEAFLHSPRYCTPECRVVHRCKDGLWASPCSLTGYSGTSVADGYYRVQPSALIAPLVVINLALQLFDGLATYVGWERFGEANPLLHAAFGIWGAGPTLFTTKIGAGLLVLGLARVPRPQMVAAALAVTGMAYLAFSFIPWTVRLAI